MVWYGAYDAGPVSLTPLLKNLKKSLPLATVTHDECTGSSEDACVDYHQVRTDISAAAVGSVQQMMEYQEMGCYQEESYWEETEILSHHYSFSQALDFLLFLLLQEGYQHVVEACWPCY